MGIFDPFRRKKVQMMDPKELCFTQVDFTDRFDSRDSIQVDEWVDTVPINSTAGEGSGLPEIAASAGEIYAIAARLSEIREMFQVPTDGVYCPLCHIASVDYDKLHAPCPNCGRDLLAFGWT